MFRLDPWLIAEADWVIDLGPKRGEWRACCRRLPSSALRRCSARRRGRELPHDAGMHRSVKSLERQDLRGLELDKTVHAPRDALRDEHLVLRRLGAQPRGEIGDGADRAIVPASFETDRSERGVA